MSSGNQIRRKTKSIGDVLPKIAQTRSGVMFDPRSDVWQFRDGVQNISCNFDCVPWASDVVKIGFKQALLWQLKNNSPSHSENMYVKTIHLLKFLVDEFGEIPQEINSSHVMSYLDETDVRKKGYLSALGGFLKKWQQLGYEGVSEGLTIYLNSIKLKGNPKGEAVRTMDPEMGPLTMLETEALFDGVAKAFQEKIINTEDYLLLWLMMAIGMRPKQYAGLKVCDLKRQLTKNGDEIFTLSIPRAKQQGVMEPRGVMRDRAILPEVGRLMMIHIETVKTTFKNKLPDVNRAPMFPARQSQNSSQGYEYHTSANALASRASSMLDDLRVYSHRTGKLLHNSPVRFRRTLGTRAAEEGHGPLVIAGLLDHSDTQNVGVYIASTPGIIDRIDRAIAMELAPLAQAFAGKLILNESQATRRGDPSSRIIDLRIDRSGSAVGSCGTHSYCSFGAPIACYRCTCFEPWQDGPHEKVLNYLLEQRERLLENTDKRIASVNDLTIIAVAQVVKYCEDAKLLKLGQHD